MAAGSRYSASESVMDDFRELGWWRGSADPASSERESTIWMEPISMTLTGEMMLMQLILVIWCFWVFGSFAFVYLWIWFIEWLLYLRISESLLVFWFKWLD